MTHGPRVLVTGAGGFIGHHLVSRLSNDGYWVRGVDIKAPEHRPSDATEFVLLDLRRWEHCVAAMDGIDHVYALAADMGGMGFISSHHAEILHNNALINIHTIEAARQARVSRYFFASSACVYPESLQRRPDIAGLKEDEAYPAMPQDAYGWEKLIVERLCRHYAEDYGLAVRIARFHNIYGPFGTWSGGREKVPAALCRKIALAKLTGKRSIDIWGDGQQTRSFCYIADCVDGIGRLMQSAYNEPLNLGRDEMVSINELADLIAGLAGVEVALAHVAGPEGVRGRNSDNSTLRAVLGWEPGTTLAIGLAETYSWIEGQVAQELAATGGQLLASTSSHRRQAAMVHSD
jgi:GDP-D-mannose 3',5'-epimerase